MTPTLLHPTDLIAVPVPGDANISLDFVGNKIMAAIEPGNYKFIGTCTKSNIDFDVESILSKHPLYDSYYTHYGDEEDWFKYAKGSFRSLLTANGLHFENPHEEIIYEGTNPERIKSAIQQNEKWQTAQNNLVEKLVILKRV